MLCVASVVGPVLASKAVRRWAAFGSFGFDGFLWLFLAFGCFGLWLSPASMLWTTFQYTPQGSF